MTPVEFTVAAFAISLGAGLLGSLLGLGGGIVQCGACPPTWLPYVQVDDIRAATALARELGAGVLLEPREGPAGWRSVVAEAGGGEIAFWQPKSS